MDRLLKYKNPRLLKIIEIEDSFQKHKARLLKIETTKHQKKDIVLQGINNYRRTRGKRDKLVKQNSLIHDNLKKVYTRKNSATSLHNLEKSYSQRSLILTKRQGTPAKIRQRNISLQNVRLRNKLLTTKSTLKKQNLMADYKRNKTIEFQKITINANKRRHELAKLMIRQHHSKPVTSNLILPKIKKGYSTSLQ